MSKEIEKELLGEELDLGAETEDLVPDSVDMTEPLKIYLKEIGRIPLLTAEEELELGRQIAEGDTEARRKMEEANLRLVVAVAKHYAGKGMQFMDLIQEGNMALWMALSALPEVEGAAELDSYLEKQVVAAFENHIREVTGDTDQVQAVLGKAALLHEARKYLAKENSQDPSIRQLSEYTHISPEEIQDILALQKEKTE